MNNLWERNVNTMKTILCTCLGETLITSLWSWYLLLTTTTNYKITHGNYSSKLSNITRQKSTNQVSDYTFLCVVVFYNSHGY